MKKIILILLFTSLFIGCTKKSEDTGIGPIKKVELGELDKVLSEKGMEVFNSKCTPCHKSDRTTTGPNLYGITKRQSPEWIMNMILNPEQMAKENESAKSQASKFPLKMTNQNVTQEDARAILEYFRMQDLK